MQSVTVIWLQHAQWHMAILFHDEVALQNHTIKIKLRVWHWSKLFLYTEVKFFFGWRAEINSYFVQPASYTTVHSLAEHSTKWSAHHV